MTSEKYRKILLNEWKFHLEINIFIKKFSIFKYATGLKFEKFKKRIGEFSRIKRSNNLKFKRFKIQQEFGIWKI